MPRAGGQYVYLTELWGPLWGFLYGWTLVLVIQTGTIAAVAVAFATYAGQLWPALAPAPPLARLGPLAVSPVQAVAGGVILLLSALNARGLEAGRRGQNVFTVAQVAALLAGVARRLPLARGAGGRPRRARARSPAPPRRPGRGRGEGASRGRQPRRHAHGARGHALALRLRQRARAGRRARRLGDGARWALLRARRAAQRPPC